MLITGTPPPVLNGDNGLLTNARNVSPLLLGVGAVLDEFPHEMEPRHTATIRKIAATVLFNPPLGKFMKDISLDAKNGIITDGFITTEAH
jgi:hypothetical protein